MSGSKSQDLQRAEFDWAGSIGDLDEPLWPVVDQQCWRRKDLTLIDFGGRGPSAGPAEFSSAGERRTSGVNEHALPHGASSCAALYEIHGYSTYDLLCTSPHEPGSHNCDLSVTRTGQTICRPWVENFVVKSVLHIRDSG